MDEAVLDMDTGRPAPICTSNVGRTRLDVLRWNLAMSTPLRILLTEFHSRRNVPGRQPSLRFAWLAHADGWLGCLETQGVVLDIADPDLSRGSHSLVARSAVWQDEYIGARSGVQPTEKVLNKTQR
ncbi:hypothetical protein AK830_g7114 [Neonectria ditissima]|uniref:Uncharacterized protein n=1 Tax=Neonectria ditissima TaxID=78410 RepID=A0A0P7BAX9_9HYPO|nr:hypothetical protein AK830_g7114 [Neonectria ditissima]